MEKCVPGASVVQLCELGDNRIHEETAKVFKQKKNMKKGLAFPTCISVNNCICHFSPLKSDPDYILKDEDLIKLWENFTYIYIYKYISEINYNNETKYFKEILVVI